MAAKISRLLDKKRWERWWGRREKDWERLYCRLSPTLYSKFVFARGFKRELDLAHPEGMDEKLMWLKLHTYRNNPLVTKCADKYLVREYVEACGLGETLNELYHVWESPEDIDWDALPGSFVIKCNHGCGYNLLCPDKNALDISKAEKTIRQWYAEDYWLRNAELQYRGIPKRVICEKYLGASLIDYKIYCFSGEPRYVLACVGRDAGRAGTDSLRFYFFDVDWNLCPLNKDSRERGDLAPSRPETLGFMLEAARKLSHPFPFVRVDLYEASGRTVFGELTFTPAAAMDLNRLPETDLLFGSMIDLQYRPD